VARVKVHYEGWVALPADFRRSLGLEAGGELEAELVDGTIVLRPARAAEAKGSTKPERAGVAAEAAMAVPAVPLLDAAAVAQAGPTPDQVMPPAKRRGRPPEAAPEA
jgi:AbrB family looped-hinge helix DNA binding protein